MTRAASYISRFSLIPRRRSRSLLFHFVSLSLTLSVSLSPSLFRRLESFLFFDSFRSRTYAGVVTETRTLVNRMEELQLNDAVR